MPHGETFSKLSFLKICFLRSRYGVGTVIVTCQNRNRNTSFSKVGTGTGTVKNSYCSTTLLGTDRYQYGAYERHNIIVPVLPVLRIRDKHPGS